MSAVMPIDTLKAAKRLQQEDTFSPEQAERIAEVLSDLDVASATKDDLEALEKRLTARIDKVDGRIDDLENRMDERFAQAKEEREAIEKRLTQRIELSEQRTDKQISELQSGLYRILLLGFGGVAALVSVLNYVFG